MSAPAELQTAVWRRLIALRGRLPHALLLHGPAGVGKLQLAERFAQLMLCESAGQGTEPCGACASCRWFLGGNHPDLRYVEPAAFGRYAEREEEADDEETKPGKPSTEIKIGQLRALQTFVNTGSHRAGRRIVIVHPAEEMNAAAANSLLKNLEEPPAGAMFILVSHRPARLLPTIRSRCIAQAVPRPERAAAEAWLAAQGVEEPGRWLAYAGGSPRRALEIATGEQGEKIDGLLRALGASDLEAAATAADREALELLAELLQKVALDRAYAALGGRPRFVPELKLAAGDQPGPWLAFARAMGRNRLLARHPLNPRLFAAEMLAGMPGRN